MATRLLTTQRIVNLAADPATGTSGEIYFNTTSGVLRFHNGTIWSDFAGGGGGGGDNYYVSTEVALSNSWWLGV